MKELIVGEFLTRIDGTVLVIVDTPGPGTYVLTVKETILDAKDVEDQAQGGQAP